MSGLREYDYVNWKTAQRDRMVAWEASQPAAFDLPFYINELFGELGEAANVIKKLDREYAKAPGSRATKEQLAEELADGLICVRNLAIKIGLPDRLDNRPAISESSHFKTLSEYGRLLGRYFGDVCIYSTDLDKRPMSNYLAFLQVALYQTAGAAHIDLDDATVAKWNQTSEKNGFPHRMRRW